MVLLAGTAVLQDLADTLAEVDSLAEADILSRPDIRRRIGLAHILVVADLVDTEAGRIQVAVAADNNLDCHRHTADEVVVAEGTVDTLAVADTVDAEPEHRIVEHSLDCIQVRHSSHLGLDRSSVAADCSRNRHRRSRLGKTFRNIEINCATR